MIIKNSRIRQYLAQNRYKILFGVIGIILLLLILRNVSDISKQQEKQKASIKGNETNILNTYRPQSTVIKGESVPSSQQEKNSSIINAFVRYCNEGQIENAYNLLTQDCKETTYPNIELFKTNFVETRFNTKKIADIQSWYNDIIYTYKVRLTEDILSTGDASMSNAIEEYISVVKEDGEERLNINSYIGRKSSNASGSTNNVTIKVLSKDMYLDYEVYNLQITNNTQKEILLDSRQDTETAYILTKTGSKFRAIIYELSEKDLIIEAGTTKKVSIKFNKIYNPSLQDNTINFTDIIMDYEEYSNSQDKENYKNISSIQVEV